MAWAVCRLEDQVQDWGPRGKLAREQLDETCQDGERGLLACSVLCWRSGTDGIMIKSVGSIIISSGSGNEGSTRLVCVL